MIKKILLTSLVVLAGAALVFGSTTEWATGFKLNLGTVPASTEVSVKARDLTLVCPGALQSSGGKSGAKLGAFSALDSALLSASFAGTTNSGATPATVEILELPTESGAAPAAEENIPARVSKPTAITVFDEVGALEQGSALLSANQIQRASIDSLAGLAGAACQKPTSEQWLLGGSTVTGRESLLILSNPSKVAAIVDLQVYSEAGALDGPGLAGISVAAGKTELIQLASIAPKTTSFAIHLKARGGSIASWLQQKTQRGLSAEGVDFVGPSPSFGTEQVIPGVLVRGTKTAKKLIADNADYLDLKPTLRVYVPGDKDATFTAQIMSSDQKSLGTVIQQTVAAGRVAEFGIDDLVDGDYVAFIKADQPIGAALRLSRTAATNQPVTDYAWLTSGHVLTGRQAIAIPTAGISKLSLANLQAGSIEVTIAAGGNTSKLALREGASRVIEVAPGAALKLESTGPFAATLIVDVAGQVAAVPLVDYRNQKEKVLVSVR